MAENLGLNPQTVANRVESLINSKTITIRALLNPNKLGFKANSLIALRVKPSKIDEVCDQLIDNLNVNLVETTFGRFDILVIAHFSNWKMLHDFINQSISRIEGVMHVKPFFINEVIKRYEKLFKKEPCHNETVKLKETDWKLIEELVIDGRANVNYLAKKLGAHVTTIYRRISALKDNHIIKIIAVVNPSKIPNSSHAHILLDVEPAKINSICKKIFHHPEITLIMTTICGSRIIIGVEHRKNELLYDFIKMNIANIKGISFIETFIRAETKKRFYGWLLEENYKI